MKFYLLSDSEDIFYGMRLAGVDGKIVKHVDEFRSALYEVIKDESVAVVLLAIGFIAQCKDYILDLKLRLKSPLLVEIPSESDTGSLYSMLLDYVHKTTGMNLSF